MFLLATSFLSLTLVHITQRYYSSGTFGMEAVARQFATDEHVMVIRNGWFSYRWTEIFEMGPEKHHIPASHTVLLAQPVATTDGSDHVHFAPHAVDDVIAKIKEERPKVLFAPHVETSTGSKLVPCLLLRRKASLSHPNSHLFHPKPARQ